MPLCRLQPVRKILDQSQNLTLHLVNCLSLKPNLVALYHDFDRTFHFASSVFPCAVACSNNYQVINISEISRDGGRGTAVQGRICQVRPCRL